MGRTFGFQPSRCSKSKAMPQNTPSKNCKEEPRLFKKLTAKNWRQRDRVVNHFKRIREGQSLLISDDEWAETFLKCELSPAVPAEVRNLFEVAQGVHCFGCYFYPLFTLGNEQLYRVLEAALTYKCDQFKAPEGVNKFERRITWLRKKGLLSGQRSTQWNAARKLRNSSSHSIQQSLIDPPGAISGLRTAVELINELFITNKSSSR